MWYTSSRYHDRNIYPSGRPLGSAQTVTRALFSVIGERLAYYRDEQMFDS